MNISQTITTEQQEQHATADQFGAVVLNYNDYQSAITCVHSLIECSPAPVRIVVVDNDSPNESLQMLEDSLAGLPSVEVVDSGFNGGYSYGNNVGIRRLRQFGCQHIVIATSDTIVVSRDLLPRLAEAISTDTGIVAPQIVSTAGNDNPSVERLSVRYLLDLFWFRHGMPGIAMRRRVAAFVRRFVLRQRPGVAGGQSACEGVVAVRDVYMLHGAFLCLTDRFLADVGEMDEDIFMFGEEDLLAWLCLDNGLMQTLVSDVVVRHAHDSSVNVTWGDRAEERVVEHQRNSGRVLLKKVPMGPLWRAFARRRSGLRAG